MSHDPDNDPALPRIGAEPPGVDPERDDPALPAPVQEHLAQQLRAAYQQTSEKPAFLGDPTLPPEIEEKVEQLAERERAMVREKAHELATEAVEAALEEVVNRSRGEGGESAKPTG
jgi:DNA-binding transcriptional MerR regulator